jgi:hypothetical protein
MEKYMSRHGKIHDLGQALLKAMIINSVTKFKINECKV